MIKELDDLRTTIGGSLIVGTRLLKGRVNTRPTCEKNRFSGFGFFGSLFGVRAGVGEAAGEGTGTITARFAGATMNSTPPRVINPTARKSCLLIRLFTILQAHTLDFSVAQRKSSRLRPARTS